jgi:hypothetical protein
MKAKLDERMALSAAHSASSSQILSVGRLAIEFPMNFCKYYLFRRHFTGGFVGLRFAAIQSWFRVIKVYRKWRNRGLAESR